MLAITYENSADLAEFKATFWQWIVCLWGSQLDEHQVFELGLAKEND